MDDKPIIRCLIGYPAFPFGVWIRSEVVTLEEAAEYAMVGFAVLVDPADEQELVRWEQGQRAARAKRKWFEAPD